MSKWYLKDELLAVKEKHNANISGENPLSAETLLLNVQNRFYSDPSPIKKKDNLEFDSISMNYGAGAHQIYNNNNL